MLDTCLLQAGPTVQCGDELLLDFSLDIIPVSNSVDGRNPAPVDR